MGRILIVDDDPRMRDLFAAVLGRDGHDVETAASVGEAAGMETAHDLAASENGTSGPAIILADAGLAPDDVPGIGAALRARWPASEVVYLVDAARPELKRRLERGRLRHFARPFQIENLRDLVNGLLERQERAGR